MEVIYNMVFLNSKIKVAPFFIMKLSHSLFFKILNIFNERNVFKNPQHSVNDIDIVDTKKNGSQFFKE